MRHIKPSSMTVSLVVFLPLLWKGITCLAGYSIRVSPSVSVQEGLCLTIPCTFTANYRNTFTNSFGYWKQMPISPDYIVATNDKSSEVKKTNFNLTGNPDTGDCTLTITGARKEDEGEYFFRFEESKYSKVKYSYNREMRTTITVPDLTEEPVISDVGTLTAGIDKTVTCAPPGDCHVTSFIFQWKKSDVSGIWKNSSTVTFTPSLEDHQKTITCEMRNSTQRTILLDVCCPTSVTITSEINGKKKKKLDSFKVTEGSSVILRCSVQSNLTLNVTWMDEKNNVLQCGTEKDLELRLENTTMNQTGTYTCSALTEHVINSANVNITVQYPPRIMEITIHSSNGTARPASPQVDINLNEKLTLVCRADGDPPSTVVWIRGKDEGNTSIISNNGLSAVMNVTSSMADVYRCSAWNALGLRERLIKIAIKQDNSGSANTQKPIDSQISYRDIAIAFICGIIITTLIVLLYKLIKRKKTTKKNTYLNANDNSANAEPQTDDIYAKVGNPEQKAEEETYNNIQDDLHSVNLDQDDLHYSTVAFTEKPSKMPSSQPETEYAEIKRK
ncbi:sialic acid-binding Ig-like lectin 13 [Hyla sarda]|uniref:sialic acid-binding Ig-like lectin 13 n=1 Tax=Hyla sarda TaxID=327740 RepID=UPI0024C40D12|nr:sialic acid-binding Ig-like lectin 13 [Hyla sarda]XP_056398688.1 sialic acid-binding Ig-like lectin 13 [Hyla sarda]XP_056398689.1 sialic acid-binding Ig-like lectin 13 [Hyla sarda]